MKKILLFVLTITLLLGLGACDSSSPSDSDNELLEQLNDLELRVTQLETILEQVGFLEGLNGIVVPYLIPQSNLTTMSTILIGDKVKDDDFDKNKTAPSYIIDEIGNYVSFQDVVILLKEKYFPLTEPQTNDLGNMSYTAGIQLYDYSGAYSLEEVVARSILLIQELQQYSFYVLSSNLVELHYYKIDDGVLTQIQIQIPLVVIINDFFEINSVKVLDGFYEMELDTYTSSINKDLVNQYYDSLTLADTFSGYVLNME